jgi:uncharacterized protein YqgC (DUF456 family)
MSETIGWILSLALILAGLAGIFLPALPGLPLVWLGILAHKLFIPGILSWWTVVLLGLLTGVAVAVEWLSGAWGARAFGSSKWGMWGALTGGVVGLFFGFIPGLLIGPLVGAFLFEWLIGRRKKREAGKAMVGVAAGIVVSGLFKLGTALVMVVWFVVDLLV